MHKLMIVEDDVELKNFLSRSLEESGFQINAVENGNSALAEAVTYNPDLIILDQNLPDITGQEVLEKIRLNLKTKNIPVVILTGFSTEQSVLKAFDLGADDYIEKPFSFDILLRRVKAVLKRKVPSSETGAKIIYSKDGLTLDCNTYRVKIQDQALDTTAMEFNILKELFKANGKTLSRTELISRVSGVTTITPRTIDVHICAIRKKLNQHGKNIETIRGIGYRLDI